MLSRENTTRMGFSELALSVILALWIFGVSGLLATKIYIAAHDATSPEALIRMISLGNVGDFVAGVISVPLLIYAIRVFFLQRIELGHAVDALKAQSDQLLDQSRALQSQTQLLREQLQLQVVSESIKSMPDVRIETLLLGDKHVVSVGFGAFEVRDVHIDVIRPGLRHANGYPIVEPGLPALASLGNSRFDIGANVACPIFVRLSFRTVTDAPVSRLYTIWTWGSSMSRIKDFSDEEIAEKLNWHLLHTYEVTSDSRRPPWC